MSLETESFNQYESRADLTPLYSFVQRYYYQVLSYLTIYETIGNKPNQSKI